MVFRSCIAAAALASSLAAQPALQVSPIDGLAAKDLHDVFKAKRGARIHKAIDIMEPRGTPIHAVADGSIAKLLLNRLGGITIYQFDAAGSFCYYYAHLDHYAEDIREGMEVVRGDVIGYVGSTGNAQFTAPHLHLGISRLSWDKKWWKGVPINPYPLLMQLVRPDWSVE